MSTQSRMTTLAGLLGESENPDTSTINRIEIPLIQRDYAQGRISAAVDEIRATFLDVLYSALVGDSPVSVGLDFIYGDVKGRALQLLDGQQRLTTLFLLHWYVACRAGTLNERDGWTRFTYATRPSARLFCQRLVAASLPDSDTVPSAWIVDRPWYLFVWRHDPTIQSMLVMLDAIHERFGEADARVAWERLTDPRQPAISFMLLELSAMSSPEDLYVKMNSRGRPLTEFENFKAHFEATIKGSPRATEFEKKVDQDWSDLLWPFRGVDNLIDDEFMRYMEFATELCEWREDRVVSGRERLNRRAEAVFGKDAPRRNENLDFLFSAFDLWVKRPIPATLAEIFTSPTETDLEPGGRVRLFSGEVNLFESCCLHYGETRGNARVFSLSQTLLLYAVLVHLRYDTDGFVRRVRVLRNLIEASSDRLRVTDMPKLVAEAESYIREGSLEAIKTFSQAQVEDELAKAAFLAENPELDAAVFRLEDQRMLRGCLSAFELDAQVFAPRSETFQSLLAAPELWPSLTGALLAVGEYQRIRPNKCSFQFGTGSKDYENVWRVLLTGALREDLKRTREVLAKFLDAVSSSPLPLADALQDIQAEWLREQEASRLYDWRYYLVKYPSSDGGSGIYYTEGGVLGYSLCMIRGGKIGIWSYYRDPYLSAIRRELAEPTGVKDPWFTGYESNPRWLRLARSDVGLRSVGNGFELQLPAEGDEAKFKIVCAEFGVNDEGVLVQPQTEVDAHLVDTGDQDRVQLGVAVVRRLIELGL